MNAGHGKRYYLVTSVIGGIGDAEFSHSSLLLFQWVKAGRIKCLYSDVTVWELFAAPENIKKFFSELPGEYLEKVPMTIAAIELANEYVLENAVGKSSFDDCLHIALATINRADILVSWNFKHMVNASR
jgi:hypothetical protein